MRKLMDRVGSLERELQEIRNNPKLDEKPSAFNNKVDDIEVESDYQQQMQEDEESKEISAAGAAQQQKKRTKKQRKKQRQERLQERFAAEEQ